MIHGTVRYECFRGHLMGSGELSGKILLVKIVKNYKIYAYFRAGWVK